MNPDNHRREVDIPGHVSRVHGGVIDHLLVELHLVCNYNDYKVDHYKDHYHYRGRQ